MKFPTIPRHWIQITALLLAASAWTYSGWASAIVIPNTPLGVTPPAKPLVMLAASRDHRLFYEAYNDASDVDGDGTLDIRFKPAITYLGLFDSSLCYTHNNNSDNAGLFTPSGATSGGDLRQCSNAWSGNFLNYLTTSRIDALKVVLYGGTREVDTATETILRRTYIPQDAHSWAKEYTSTAADGYDIAKYAPLAQPNANQRHFFGNVTANASTNCATLSNCSNLPPWLSVVTNSNRRVWEWASTERPVLNGSGGGTRTNYTVRVTTCTATYNSGCKRYPNGNFKPIGLLHEYSENDTMLFGLITGSYNKNMSGGRLRKVVSSFGNEITANTGVYLSNVTGIVRSFDNLRIRGYNDARTDQSYRTGWDSSARRMNEGEFVDWGNPMGEILYEAVRYFAGKNGGTAAFAGNNPIGNVDVDTHVGLGTATWDDPYHATSAARTAGAMTCSKANILAISDTNISYDSDQVPGSYFNSFTGDLTGFNVSTELDLITDQEPGLKNSSRFIGESNGVNDSAPTPKTVTSLARLRGLAPEEPTKQGTYHAAGVASWANRHNIRSDISGQHRVNTFAVALASPLPQLAVPMPNGRVVTFVPFAKSVGGAFGITNTKGNFQPTNQIVDLYVEYIANSGAGDQNNAINGGRYEAKFRINFEDVEQGADHDMDVIVEYLIKANADNTVTISLTPTYEAGSINHRIGYVVSGTTRDGVYLEVQDTSDTTYYFLNTPPGRNPGYCDQSPIPSSDCNRLPYLNAADNASEAITTSTSTRRGSIRTLAAASAGTAASLLKDPLWYAAKWGGFVDSDGDNLPNLVAEWSTQPLTAGAERMPDNYFFVQNPSKLRESLRKAFNAIYEVSSSASNITANSTSVSTDTLIYQAKYNSGNWSGDLEAYGINDTGLIRTPSWKASERLPAPGSRNIYTWDGAPVAFTYAALPPAIRNLFGSDDAERQRVIDYLRGDATNEGVGEGKLRIRASATSGNSKLGHIVHSSPYFARELSTVFIAANNGMLHALNASSGEERFSFIPSAVLPSMKHVSDQGYTHPYLLDGEIAVSERSKTVSGKNILVSMLGRGGRGLFALDITPASPTATVPATTPTVAWQYHGAAPADNDLGLMVGRAVIAKIRTGTTGGGDPVFTDVLITGNGYNSPNGSAVLYVFDLTTGEVLKKIDTQSGADNGLSAPAVVLDGNGVAQAAYAGDLKGNLWKFNLSGNTLANWGSAFLESSVPVPFFQARDASNKAQPITSQPSVAVSSIGTDPNFGRTFVFVGTGSYIAQNDLGDMSAQTIYGLIDKGARIADRAALVGRHISYTSDTFNGDTKIRLFSPSTAGSMTDKSGWYLDWLNPPTPPGTARGERVISSARVLYNLYRPALVVSTIIPVDDPCKSGGEGFVNLLDPWSGGNIDVGLVDVNRDNNFDNDLVNGAFIGSLDLGVGTPTELILIGRFGIVGGSGGAGDGGLGSGGPPKTIGDTPLNIKEGALRGRLSWREIIRD